MNKYSCKAVIFDLDGVITNTAKLHSIAWKEMFDEFQKEFEVISGKKYDEFDYERDYLPYVDGKPRYKGVESYLQSRGISIPYGFPSDAPENITICGLGNRKNLKFNQILDKDGVEVFGSTVLLLEELQKAGIRIAVASSSKNCRAVLERAGLLHFFEARVDGEVSVERGLKGKPEADIFLESAKDLAVLPEQSIVIEDAVSGIEAGVNGNFGFVLGIARENNRAELKRAGAHYIVTDLSEIDGLAGLDSLFRNKQSS